MTTMTMKNGSADAPATIKAQPLTLMIGAEISGVDLTQPIAPEVVREIRDALLKWKVIFFRDQHIDHAHQIAFARHFGELTVGHAVFGHIEDYPEIYAIAKHRTANRSQGQEQRKPWSGWHADITAAHNPPCASILRGDIVPPYGGDTQWTNLVAAYEGLSETMKTFIDGLRGIHRFAPQAGVKATEEYAELVRDKGLASEHPLVRVHPETGERSLYVSPSFLKEIVGLSPTESIKILELLWEHAIRPEYTVRFKWEPGSIAFWDNRSTAHLAPRDIFLSDFDRQFYRVTLVGDVPVGVDGQPSKALEGEQILAV